VTSVVGMIIWLQGCTGQTWIPEDLLVSSLVKDWGELGSTSEVIRERLRTYDVHHGHILFDDKPTRAYALPHHNAVGPTAAPAPFFTGQSPEMKTTPTPILIEVKSIGDECGMCEYEYGGDQPTPCCSIWGELTPSPNSSYRHPECLRAEQAAKVSR